MVFLFWIENTEAASAALSRSRQQGSVHFDYESASLPSLPSKILESKYLAKEDKWAYKPDNRGKYVHMPVPYNGKRKLLRYLQQQNVYIKII